MARIFLYLGGQSVASLEGHLIAVSGSDTGEIDGLSVSQKTDQHPIIGTDDALPNLMK